VSRQHPEGKIPLDSRPKWLFNQTTAKATKRSLACRLMFTYSMRFVNLFPRTACTFHVRKTMSQAEKMNG
jgi:hypothetical protein